MLPIITLTFQKKTENEGRWARIRWRQKGTPRCLKALHQLLPIIILPSLLYLTPPPCRRHEGFISHRARLVFTSQRCQNLMWSKNTWNEIGRSLKPATGPARGSGWSTCAAWNLWNGQVQGPEKLWKTGQWTLEGLRKPEELLFCPAPS